MGQAQVLTQFTSSNSSLLTNQIRDLTFDPAGRIWISTSAGIVAYNPTTDSALVTPITTNTTNGFNYLYSYPNNGTSPFEANVLLGTAESGQYTQYNLDNQTWSNQAFPTTSYTEDFPNITDFPAGNNTVSFYVFGTTQGLYEYQGENSAFVAADSAFTAITPHTMYYDPTNPGTNIWYVGGPQGTTLYYMNVYWVESGDSGYYAYKTTGQPQTKNQLFNLQGQPNAMELSPDQLTFLMPTVGGGIILFDIATGTQAVHQELGSPVGSYDAATYDSSGNIWFIYRDSLDTERLARWNYDPTTQTYTSTAYDVELLGVKRVNALHIHGDTVWVGTAQSGVFQYAYLATPQIDTAAGDTMSTIDLKTGTYQWYFKDQISGGRLAANTSVDTSALQGYTLIPGATTYNYSPSLGVGYYVAEIKQPVITGDTIISVTKPVLISTISSVTGIIATDPIESRLAVYPNPNSGQVHINLPVSLSGATIHLINVLGEIVSTQAGVGASLTWDLSAVGSGLYYVQITDSSGQILGTRKLVLE